MFITTDEIHCHHKVPKHKGGNDRYKNLCLVIKEAHILIHAKSQETIAKYKNLLKLSKEKREKLNDLRLKVGNEAI